LALCLCCVRLCFFFFQAEDGIRDRNVTGVQTCALPICPLSLHVQFVRHLCLPGGKQVGVAVGNINAFMSHPVSDCQGRKAHVNEQRNVGVPQVVYSDPLDPSLFRPPVHLPVEVGFCHRENAVGGFHPIQALDIVPHFFTEENGHLNDPVALRCLGAGNHILGLERLAGLGDRDSLFPKVEVFMSEGQQLPRANAAPVEHFKGVIGEGLVHHGLGKFQILRLCPEQHFPSLGLSHVARLG